MADMFVVEKEGDNAILRASECPNFASFLAAIRGKFTDLLSDDFPLKFILEPNQLSSVKSQRDFENVILLCQTLQRRVVYLTIPRNCTTANSGTNSLPTPGNENAPTLNRNPKRKLPEEERNDGQCTISTIQVCNVDPQQEISSSPHAPTEKQNSKRKLPEEERNEGECGMSRISLYDVAPQQDSGSLLNAPAENQNSKRKLPEEERNEGECGTSRITLYDVAPQLDSGSLLNAPAEKQNSKRKLPEEERNEGECATSSIPVYDVYPQEESSLLPNAPPGKQKCKRKLPEAERYESECATSPIPVYDDALQLDNRSLLNAPTIEKQKFKKKLLEEERNEGECATSRITLYDVAPQQDSGSLLNAPAEKQKSKRKLPEEERNEGECALSRITLYDVAPQQDNGLLLNAPAEKQKSKRKLPEEERSEGECATSPIPVYDVDSQEESSSLPNAPPEKQKCKRKLPEEERDERECATSPISDYDDAPQLDTISLLSAPPIEKQKFKKKLPEEARNQSECATSPIPVFNGAPQQDSRSLLNAPTEKQKSMMKLPEQERDEGEGPSSHMTYIPLNDVSAQPDNGSLLSADWANKISHVGQEFRGGVEDFRCQLVKYASKMGFKFTYEKNNARYILVHCRERDMVGCKWFVKAGIDLINRFSFVIKKANLVHTCTLSVEGTTQRLGQKILRNLVQDKMQTNPKISAKQLKVHLLNDYGFDLTYEKVWRSVKAVQANVLGFVSDKDYFNELHWYRNAIIRTNPGSQVTLETEEGTNRFKRFFVAFKGSLQGFKKCRPMLFVDGISMKKQCKVTLFSATAKDGNNGLFPVAFAVVDAENGNNWIWFLSKLRDVIEHEKEIMYFSDRAGGLLTAFNMVWEKPLHFFCLYHLMKYLRGMYQLKKFSDVFKNKMCNLLKDAAYAPNHCLFNTAIAEFQRQGGETAAHFLTDLPVEKWAVAFAPDLLRYGELTSNTEESFTKWILDVDVCPIPITYVLDSINTKLMQWFVERREEQKNWTGALTPKMEEMWNALERLSSWTISSTTIEGVFNVLSNPPCTVDLNRRTCTCYQWQITGFPCCHAVGCINQAWWNIRGVVDACFFNDTYKLIYESNIEAIPTTEKNVGVDINTPLVLPPLTRMLTGKRRKKRVLSKGEDNRKNFHCGRCGRFGTHLWVTCSDALD